MYKIEDQFHSKELIKYSFSTFLEKMAYYGVRFSVILYMISETINIPSEEAFNKFGLIVTLLIISKILGGILGDFIFKNNLIPCWIGSILMTIGCFSIGFFYETGIYFGLGSLALGIGMISNNFYANFSKSYINKPKLLDAGYTIIFIGSNIGSFLGVIGIGYIGETFGWTYSFMISGILSFINFIILLTLKKQDNHLLGYNQLKYKNSLIIGIILSFLIMFYIINDFASISLNPIQTKFHTLESLAPYKYLFIEVNAFFSLPLIISLGVIWSYYYQNTYSKLIISFILSTLAYTLILLLPENPTMSNLTTYIPSIFCLALAESIISPLIYSKITKHFNPKYLASLFGLIFIPSYLFTYFLQPIISTFNYNLSLNLWLSLFLTGSIGFILIIGNYFRKTPQ